MARSLALLLLADGALYRGHALGARGISYGELCFNTGMTGYQEVYSDPSYYGQILISTTAHVGNYGVLDSESESKGPQVSGVVLNSYSDYISRAAATKSLEDYLIEHNRVSITGIDTRSVVQHLTQTGTQNALICSASPPSSIEALKEILYKAPTMEGRDLSAQVTTSEAYSFGPSTPKYRIAVLDFGIKRSMLKHFATRGIGGKVFPARTSFETLTSYDAEGYFLSNGPGDPAAMDYVLPIIQQMIKSQKPIFGICLGHQLLARSYGVSTYKLPFGHRGMNHPVLDKRQKKAFMSTQNHGFSVDRSSFERCHLLEETHTHLNDGTVSGLRAVDTPVFSVQFHPESTPGTHDALYLFDQFTQMLQAASKP